MDSNLKSILATFEKLKGQQVITGFNNIERLIAIGDDTEDWYWVCWDGRKTTWHSCCLHLIPLKGHLLKRDYESLVRSAKTNDYDSPNLWNAEDKAEIAKINLEAREEIQKMPDKNCKFVTSVCWDIN